MRFALVLLALLADVAGAATLPSTPHRMRG
jgi:hypothetical protein